MKNCLCYYDPAVQGDLLQLFGLEDYFSGRCQLQEQLDFQWGGVRRALEKCLHLSDVLPGDGVGTGCCKTSLRELVHDPSQENWLSPETLSSLYIWELGKQRAAQC